MDTVVFDLLYTLVHPGTYPGGAGRIGWLAGLLSVEPTELARRWAEFEPVVESGSAPHGADGCAPELAWVQSVASELGRSCPGPLLATIEADWDLTRRAALRSPHPEAIATLTALHDQGMRVGVLSNTHAMEIRAWPESPLASAIDAVAFSHIIGHLKPDPAAYDNILGHLGAAPERAAFVGDGGSNELAGARDFGFALVVLADETPTALAPSRLPELRRQADASISTLSKLPALLQGRADAG